MIYEAPYSAWYVSGAGNTLQLLNLWDATPEPPRFGGDIEVFETSLVDGTRAFAEGLGSAVEHRTFAFYRWFKDYEEMARYQENLAVWMATNQNGTLYMQFADQPQWRFTSVLAGYQFETENFIPPPSPEDGYLCLLVSINMTLTDRVPDNSAWVFSVTPSSVSVPAAGGQYAFSVVSYFNPGEIGQGWKAFENDGISISNIINGNNGSFRVTVPPNETTEEKSIYLTVSQDGTGIAPLIEITQAASTPQEKTVGSPVFLEGDPAKIAALGMFNWRQYRMKWGEQVDGDPPPAASIKSVTVARGSANNISTALSLYVLNEDGSTTTLLATSNAAVNDAASQQATFTFPTPPKVEAGMQLIFQPGAVVYTKIENIAAYDWGGLAYRPYPAAITTPAVMPAMSLDVEYIG